MAFDTALLEDVRDIPFEIYKASTTFYPAGALSEVKLGLDVYEDQYERIMVIRAGELFDFKKLEAKPGPNQEAFEFIRNSRSKPWPPLDAEKLNEQNVVMEISKNIFLPLCRPGEVILKKNYSKLVLAGAAGLKAGNIGIGSWKTWHGTPDMRVMGTEIVVRKATVDEKDDDVEEDDSDVESCMTDGATTTVKAKVKLSEANLAQVVATCVVSSFTENKLHPNKQAVVPTILIDLNQFQVCLYDCRLDVLLISVPKLLSTKNGLSRSAMLFLWLTSNHRLFLRQLPDSFSRYKSMIKTRLEENRHLQYFTELSVKDTDWMRQRNPKRRRLGMIDITLEDIKKQKTI